MSEDLRSKLQECRAIADHGKSMVHLYDIPALAQEPLETIKFDCNFHLYEKILVRDHGFQSIEKPLKELKNKRQLPQQDSLF